MEEVIKIAVGELGVTEQPLGSNNVKYNTEFYGKAVSGGNFSWCANFVGWCFWKAGIIELTLFYNKGDKFKYNAKNAAYCPNWVSAAKKINRWVTSDYERGDVVLFDWSGNGIASHIGIIESVTRERTPGGKITLTTIEGNTGDMVKRCARGVDKTVLGVYRPDYASITVQTPNDFTPESAINKLVDTGWINSPDLWLSIMRGEKVASGDIVKALIVKFAQAVSEKGK